MSDLDYIVVIPARYGSTRFLGKPLALIQGQPMLQRVWQQACKSNASRVVVATDDQRIFDCATDFGAEVVMTRDDHVSGTDRLAEVVQALNIDDEAVIVNVQGDEPLIPGEVVEQVARNLCLHKQAAMATLCEPISNLDDFNNPNVVKVVANDIGFAQYFSRAPIPVNRRDNSQLASNSVYRHIGVYAYRARTLKEFVARGPHAIELSESLEQLRVMMWGGLIHIEPAIKPVPGGIDTPEDLERLNRELEND